MQIARIGLSKKIENNKKKHAFLNKNSVNLSLDFDNYTVIGKCLAVKCLLIYYLCYVRKQNYIIAKNK